MEHGTLLRIGELSKRSGVSPELLRAWEQRYGFPNPERTPAGWRVTNRVNRQLEATDESRALLRVPLP